MLHNYLDRAVSMQHFCSDHISGIEYSSGLQLIQYLKPKFLGRLVGFWGGYNDIGYAVSRLDTDIPIIHGYDPDIICQGAVFEYIDDSVQSVTIPAYVLSAFGLSPSYLAGRTTFDNLRMRYDDHTLPSAGVWANTPDITKLETRLWFYYLATTYIAHGCEAIHFGDVPLMAIADSGKRYYWDLLSKVRAFASSRNRGAVLCDAHAFFFGAETIYGFYYDPDIHSIKPHWERQLLFDFHSLGVYWTKPTTPPCTSTYQPLIIQPGSGLLDHSAGGINPQGWYCMHNPALIEYDNGGAASVVGCANTDSWNFYGWDNITWFYEQLSNRGKILKYSHYRIKCLDIYAHFQPLARRYITPTSSSWGVYNAPLSDQTVIKDLWNGMFSIPNEWIFKIFTDENVAKSDVPPASSLVFSDANRIFFISTDGYIHGYIKTNGNYNDGTWLTVSPSYAADSIYGPADYQQRIAFQVKAKSDLVTSPDGRRILYIGIDGYIHGFEVIDDWTYRYFDFMKDAMIAQSIKAVGSLIYPAADRIYYIATHYLHALGRDIPSVNDENRVHGFQYSGSAWHTVSPSYAAGSVTSQAKASGALTYDKKVFPNRIYYRNELGLLSYYEVHDLVTYSYNDCYVPNGKLLTQKLRIVGNLSIYNDGSTSRIYYVGRYIDGSQYIHCLIDLGGNHWNTVSPSYSADYFSGTPIGSQLQSIGGDVAVSPDGQTIVYFGLAFHHFSLFAVVRYFENIDNVNYSYHAVSPEDNVLPNSLQFTDSNNFYFISVKKVYHFKKAENYCNHPLLNASNYP